VFYAFPHQLFLKLPLLLSGIILMLTAADVMVREVFTVRDSLPLSEVTAFFREHKITGAPVVSEAHELLGVISETDIIRKTSSFGAWAPQTVRQIMSKPAVTVPPDEPLQCICELMRQRHIHRVIVMDNNNICGIVTSMDILNAVAQGKL
jgi:CBS domain-containing protein